MRYTLAIHGGAGTIIRAQMSNAQEEIYNAALLSALNVGEAILKKGGTSIDAVEHTVCVLENIPLFNAGRGAVFAHSGRHEMEASIMEGKNLRAGAIAGVRNVKNPISLARLVIDRSDYVFMCAEGAEEFAKQCGVEFEKDGYFFTDHRFAQLMEIRDSDKVMMDHSAEQKFGTVGAVALDVHGNLAAATSTGGLTNKRYGRLGDSSIIGSGTYANNNTCAISCTGYGEYFLRAVVAYDVSCLMEYKGLSLAEACYEVINKKLVKMGGEGGLIAADAKGNIDFAFNSEGMYRGKITSESTAPIISIYR